MAAPRNLMGHDATPTIITAATYSYAGMNAMDSHIFNLMDDYAYTTRVQRSLKRQINRALEEREAEANRIEEQALKALLRAQRESIILKEENNRFRERMREVENVDYEEENRYHRAEEWLADNTYNPQVSPLISPLTLNPTPAPPTVRQLPRRGTEEKIRLVEDPEEEIRMIEGIRETVQSLRPVQTNNMTVQPTSELDAQFQIPEQQEVEVTPSVMLENEILTIQSITEKVRMLEGAKRG